MIEAVVELWAGPSRGEIYQKTVIWLTPEIVPPLEAEDLWDGELLQAVFDPHATGELPMGLWKVVAKVKLSYEHYETSEGPDCHVIVEAEVLYRTQCESLNQVRTCLSVFLPHRYQWEYISETSLGTPKFRRVK